MVARLYHMVKDCGLLKAALHKAPGKLRGNRGRRNYSLFSWVGVRRLFTKTRAPCGSKAEIYYRLPSLNATRARLIRPSPWASSSRKSFQ